MGSMEKLNEFKAHLSSQQPYVKAAKRIEQLLDADSFCETNGLVEKADVITGMGTVDGRPIYVYSQYGPVTAVHSEKLKALYQQALNMGVAVIAMLDSQGMALEDGMVNLQAYGSILNCMSDASGVIPQIAIVFGDCAGTASIIAGLSDFVFMTEAGSLYLQSPNTFDDASHDTFKKYTSGKYHYTESGNVDFLFDQELNCLAEVKNLLSFMPSNNLDDAPVIMTDDDVFRTDSSLNTLVKGKDQRVQMKEIITSVADNNEMIEISAGYGKRLTTGFIRLNGYTAGAIAITGPFCQRAMKKAVQFINFCDAFNIPLLSFTDVSGYKVNSQTDQEVIRNASALIYAFSNATVPKINVIIRDAMGSSYLAMNSKLIGADVALAWPTANIGLMDKDNANKVLQVAVENEAVSAGAKGHIDDVITPAETRKKLIQAVEMLSSKRVFKHAKKHGSIVF